MKALLKVLKSIYNFFAGDAIILTAVALAFVFGGLMLHAYRTPHTIAAIIFVGIIVIGLATTVRREVGKRK